MFVNGCRMMADYAVATAAEDLMALHLDADEAAVRDEIEQVAA